MKMLAPHILALALLAATVHAADPITLTWIQPTKLSSGNMIGTNVITYAVHDLTACDVLGTGLEWKKK